MKINNSPKELYSPKEARRVTLNINSNKAENNTREAIFNKILNSGDDKNTVVKIPRN